MLLLLVLLEEEELSSDGGGVSGAGALLLIVSAKELPPRKLHLSQNFPSQVLRTLKTNETNIIAGIELMKMQNVMFFKCVAPRMG